MLRRGFWGDIMNSPYIAFGVEANDGSLFKIANRAHKHNSQDVSEYSVISLMHEMQSGEQVLTKEHAIKLGATGISNEPLPEEKEKKEEEEDATATIPEGEEGEEVEEGTTIEDITDSEPQPKPEPEPEPEPEPDAEEGGKT